MEDCATETRAGGADVTDANVAGLFAGSLTVRGSERVAAAGSSAREGALLWRRLARCWCAGRINQQVKHRGCDFQDR